MFDLFRLWLGAVLRLFRTRRSLMLENLALRQQLAVFKLSFIKTSYTRNINDLAASSIGNVPVRF
jgi:hypothetical protein